MKTLLAVLFYSIGLMAEPLNCYITSEINTTVTSTARTQMLAAKNRKCLYVQNKGTLPVYLFFTTGSDTKSAITLGSSTIWIPTVVPSNAVYMRASGGTQSVTAVEGE